MKKIVVLLMAIMFVSMGFAQVTTSISASGQVNLINEDGQAVFSRYGSGYDLLTFKAVAEEDAFGFSATLDDCLLDYIAYVAADSVNTIEEVAEVTPFTTFRDWNIWFKSDVIKVILGKVRNADFRTTMPGGYLSSYLYGTDRFFGGAAYGIVAESVSLGSLTLGLGLPIPTTATASLDVVKQTNIGANYAFNGVGTLKSLIRLDFVSNSHAINLGFDYSGIENFILDAFSTMTIASANIFAFGLGAQYDMAPFSFAAEWDGQYSTGFDWELYAQATYAVFEKVTAMLGGYYMSSAAYDAFMAIGYDLVPGLTLKGMCGYNGEFHYEANVVYSISF